MSVYAFLIILVLCLSVDIQTRFGTMPCLVELLLIGIIVFPPLMAGMYRLRVKKGNFKRFSIDKNSWLPYVGLFSLLLCFMVFRLATSRSKEPDFGPFLVAYLPLKNITVDFIKPESLVPTLLGAFITIYVAFVSFILVAIQLASVQFSPRLIRQIFPQDRVIFWYSVFLLEILLLMSTLPIGINRDRYSLSDVIIIVGGMCTIPIFFRFVVILVDRLNVTNLIDAVKRRTIAEIEELYGASRDVSSLESNSGIDEGGFSKLNKPILADKFGFIEEVNKKRLLSKLNVRFQASDCSEVCLQTKFSVGQYIHVGDVVAMTLDGIDLKASDIFKISNKRSYEQDVQLGIRQLVDVAVKSLSPAVNDPTTCITAIYGIADIVLALQKEEIVSVTGYELLAKGVYIDEFRFDHIIDNAFDQIFQWGKNDFDVTRNLIRALYRLMANARSKFQMEVIALEYVDLDIFLGILKPLFDSQNGSTSPNGAQQRHQSFSKSAKEFGASNFTRESMYLAAVECLRFNIAFEIKRKRFENTKTNDKEDAVLTHIKQLHGGLNVAKVLEAELRGLKKIWKGGHEEIDKEVKALINSLHSSEGKEVPPGKILCRICLFLEKLCNKIANSGLPSSAEKTTDFHSQTRDSQLNPKNETTVKNSLAKGKSKNRKGRKGKLKK